MWRTYRAKSTSKLVIFGILLFGILEIAIIYLAAPQYYTHYLLCIPVYFLILGFSVLWALWHMHRNKFHPGRAIARLMLFNIAQMLLSFFIMAGYYYFIDVQEHTMLIAFSVFYIFFMCLKFYILYNIDKQHKIDTKRLQDAEHNK